MNQPFNFTPPSWKALALAALVSWGLTSCGSKIDSAGGESHFLRKCSNVCSAGLTCIDEVCSAECKDDDDCTTLGKAVCDTKSSPARCVAAPNKVACGSHAVGETWLCSDGCNSCSCTADGEVLSTVRACKFTCADDMTYHEVGETWNCIDGCGSCTCEEGGRTTRSDFCGSTPSPSTSTPQTVPTMPSNTLPSMTGLMPSPGTSCDYAGKTFAFGDTWTCSDGCNSCSCGMGGVSQTEKGCPGTQCTDLDGTAHAFDTAWPCAADGCKACYCDMGSRIRAEAGGTCSMCDYAGKEYPVGNSWKCSDGCNTCTCGEDGAIGQTKLGCTPIKGCTDVDGSVYAFGIKWTCGDGCHECTCQSDQSITAVETTCAATGCQVGSKMYQPNDRWACGCNTCDCRILSGKPSIVSTVAACRYPDVCYPPQYEDPDGEMCEASIPSFWFNVQTGKCEAFTYGGCNGTENRFSSQQACEASCKAAF